MSSLRFQTKPAGHYKQLRSQQGSDNDFDLITLCAGCHEELHTSR
jgi:cytochrome c553